MNQESKFESLRSAHDELFRWCSQQDFAGHDPFDALNSRLFKSTPLVKSRNARLLWTQLVKRSPADLRPLIGTSSERNAKGIALFALALLSDHRRIKTPESAAAARSMLDALLSMSVATDSGLAWGYNFDWQSRNFFAPRDSPTVVPTAFAARALIEGFQVLGQEQYLDTAQKVCNFILNDLPRTVNTPAEVCFSYAPNADTKIFNASLLAAEVLAAMGAIKNDAHLMETADRAVRYVLNNQSDDGSWSYGAAPSQSWKDNFHTAYVLFSLSRIQRNAKWSPEFHEHLKKGYDFWKNTFFLADGWPKYYDDDPYPADTHAGASAIVTFLEFIDRDQEALNHAEDVALWTVQNLRDPRGFFYYQRRRFYTVRKPYMRWSQAWMMYALANLLERGKEAPNMDQASSRN